MNLAYSIGQCQEVRSDVSKKPKIKETECKHSGTRLLKEACLKYELGFLSTLVHSHLTLLLCGVYCLDIYVNRPDGPYHWIAHFMDHWSKIHVLFPLMEKSVAEVALNLSSNVLSYIL